MKIINLISFLLFISLLSCNETSEDGDIFTRFDDYVTINVDCPIPEGSVEIFKSQQIPVSLTNLSQIEFEDIATTEVLKNVPSNRSLIVKFQVLYIIDSPPCLNNMTASDEIDVTLFKTLKELLVDQIEFNPAMTNGMDVHAITETIITIEQGQVSLIEHKNYLFN